MNDRHLFMIDQKWREVDQKFRDVQGAIDELIDEENHKIKQLELRNMRLEYLMIGTAFIIVTMVLVVIGLLA
jgi:hypothetical protein